MTPEERGRHVCDCRDDWEEVEVGEDQQCTIIREAVLARLVAEQVAAAVAEEREACAKVADGWLEAHSTIGPLHTMGLIHAGRAIGREIRARGRLT